MENTTETKTAGPEQPPPNEHRPRRLTRRTDNRIIGGVASGIADHLDVDPWLIRAAFIALTVAGGSGILLYLLGVFTMPLVTDPPGSSPLERLGTKQGRHGWWPWAILAVAVLALTDSFSSHATIVWPVLLVGFGIYLLRDQPEREFSPSASQPGPGPPQPSVTTPAYGGAVAMQPVLVRPKRERSVLFTFTLGAALLATAISVALVQGGAAHLAVQQVLAIPIVILGAGALAGAWIGRGRWLVLPALLLLPFVAAAAMAGTPFDSKTGVHEYRPATIDETQHDYELGAGKLIVDLSKVQPGADPFTIGAHTTAGEIVIVVPKDVATEINASAGAGVVEVLGRRDEGTAPRLITHTEGQGATLKLHARSGFGHVFITNDPTADEARL